MIAKRAVTAVPQVAIDARTAKGWSQDQLSEKAEVSKKTVENVEAGKPVYRRTLGKLARALGTTVDVLVGHSTGAPDGRLGDHIISFDAFVKDRSEGFVGRDFVLKAIAAFLNTHDSGYFLLGGKPGMGKSAFLSSLVCSRDYYVHHFNSGAIGIIAFRKSNVIDLPIER